MGRRPLILANTQFTEFINEDSAKVWNTLACPNMNTSIPAQDLEMAASIDNDIATTNVKSLRKMISWIMRKSSGTTRHFWDKSNQRSIWWPFEVPFKNISRKTFIRSSLVKIFKAYEEHNSGTIALHDAKGEVRESSPLHSSGIDIKPVLGSRDSFNETDLNNLQDYPEQLAISPIIETLENSNDSFLPGLSTPDFYVNKFKQPERTFDQEDDFVLPTSSIATLANAQPIAPIKVKYTLIEDRVKKEFIKLLSNPQAFLSGTCINSFMDLLKKQFPDMDFRTQS